MKTFDNKVAVVTGAASGMGRYLAVLLAKMGCNVAICDVNEEELENTAKMLANYNVATSRHVVDIADKSAIEEFHQEVIDHHQKVDLVFNNAGITVMSEFGDMPEADWDRVMQVNLDGDQYDEKISTRPENSTRGSSDQHLVNFWNGCGPGPERLPRDEIRSSRVYRVVGERDERHQFASPLCSPWSRRHQHSLIC